MFTGSSYIGRQLREPAEAEDSDYIPHCRGCNQTLTSRSVGDWDNGTVFRMESILTWE